jgi:hypothetical protein
MDMLVIIKDWGVFQDKGNGAKHRQHPRLSAFHQTLGDEFPFQQDWEFSQDTWVNTPTLMMQRDLFRTTE